LFSSGNGNGNGKRGIRARLRIKARRKKERKRERGGDASGYGGDCDSDGGGEGDDGKNGDGDGDEDEDEDDGEGGRWPLPLLSQPVYVTLTLIASGEAFLLRSSCHIEIEIKRRSRGSRFMHTSRIKIQGGSPNKLPFASKFALLVNPHPQPSSSSFQTTESLFIKSFFRSDTDLMEKQESMANAGRTYRRFSQLIHAVHAQSS
jgi:hypothetical protein